MDTLIPMAELASRWGITANTVSRRLAFLGIKPERQGNLSYITAEQLALGDDLQREVTLPTDSTLPTGSGSDVVEGDDLWWGPRAA